MSLNVVIIQGNLTDKPVLRSVPRGNGETVQVGNFTVAVSRNYRRKGSSDWETETSFIDVEVWDSSAERAHSTLDKGDPVIIEGNLKQDKWQTEDGQNRSKIKIRSNRFTKLYRRPFNGEGEQQEGEPVTTAAQIEGGADTPDDIPF